MFHPPIRTAQNSLRLDMHHVPSFASNLNPRSAGR